MISSGYDRSVTETLDEPELTLRTSCYHRAWVVLVLTRHGRTVSADALTSVLAGPFGLGRPPPRDDPPAGMAGRAGGGP